MGGKRKIHNAKFKAKVALEAVKGQQTSVELMSAYEVSASQVSTWKKKLLQEAPQIFELSKGKAVDEETLTAPLYEEISRLKMELDWLKKKMVAQIM